MSKVFIEEETLIGIGNAIRGKSGTTDLIATTDMANAISNLSSGGGSLKLYKNVVKTGIVGSGVQRIGYTIDLSTYNLSANDDFLLIFDGYGNSSSYSGNFIISYISGVFTRIGGRPTGSNYPYAFYQSASITNNILTLNTKANGVWSTYSPQIDIICIE